MLWHDKLVTAFVGTRAETTATGLIQSDTEREYNMLLWNYLYGATAEHLQQKPLQPSKVVLRLLLADQSCNRLCGLICMNGRLWQACFACISPFRANMRQVGFASAFVLIHLHALDIAHTSTGGASGQLITLTLFCNTAD